MRRHAALLRDAPSAHPALFAAPSREKCVLFPIKTPICTRADTRVRETGNKKTAHKDPLVQQYATDLGANLRRLRKGQGLSQERLGLMIGSWHSRISNIERGKVIVSFPDAVKLCRALGADPEELIDLSTLTLADYPEPADGPAPL